MGIVRLLSYAFFHLSKGSDLEVVCKGKTLPAEYILFDYQAAKESYSKAALIFGRKVREMILTLYEPFRHWSDGGSVYILSDLHFDDEDCRLMNPGWVTPEKQIAIINKTVGKGDTFICLGDVGNAKYIPMIKARKKVLLIGNHDAKGAYKSCSKCMQLYTSKSW